MRGQRHRPRGAAAPSACLYGTIQVPNSPERHMRTSARRASPLVQNSVVVHRDRFVPYLLGRISRGIASAASILYRKRLGVGINDSSIVIVLARRPRITAKDLSEDTSLNKSVISRSLS